ncbi:MAG: phosphodiester glycosidase family protein [Balneolaceae bacterium]|nr:phosphodiester glycosidase family protein [Balneolaceae bacterium]
MQKFIFLAVISAFLIPNKSTQAQNIVWVELTDSVQLPEGVRYFEGTRSSPAFKGWYFEVDTNNEDIALVPYLAEGGTETITKFAARKNAYAAINGGYFGGGISYSTLVQPGQVQAQNVTSVTRNSQSYPVIRSMFGIKEDRSMAVDWIYHFGGGVENLYRFDAPLPYEESTSSPMVAPTKESGEVYNDAYLGVGGGPILVKGDSVNVSYNEEIFWGSGVGRDNPDPRTAVGYTPDGKAILMVVDGRQGSVTVGVSLTELAQIMIDLGATEAINLDGGGSSQMVIGDQLINRPGGSRFERPVATFLAIMPADSIPIFPVVGYEQILDTGDESVEVSSGWAASANAGFYGDTPSLITLQGDGSKTVTFRPDLPAENAYELYAWWVSSSNRAKRAPFIVQHADGIDTVYADQSTDNAQWVKLGEYNFLGTSADQVTVSNFGGETGSYVVADAIRFIGVEKHDTNTEFEHSISQFELLPAYPNPFNPSTNIQYALPFDGEVNINIYTINGRLISTLHQGYQSEGTHQLRWDASNRASGVYLLSIEYKANGFAQHQTQKLTLIK